MKPWNLFIDDIRDPNVGGWIVARDSREAIAFTVLLGFPDRISFDHDLGGDDTAMKYIQFLEDGLIHGILQLPKDFSFRVHSANPVGAENIRGKMNNLIKYFTPG